MKIINSLGISILNIPDHSSSNNGMDMKAVEEAVKKKYTKNGYINHPSLTDHKKTIIQQNRVAEMLQYNNDVWIKEGMREEVIIVEKLNKPVLPVKEIPSVKRIKIERLGARGDSLMQHKKRVEKWRAKGVSVERIIEKVFGKVEVP